MNQEQESEIIKLIQMGDRNSYALLVDRYKGAIFNLAYRMTGNYQDANDVAQEAFVRAYENLKRFDRKRRFFPWLYTIALNLIRNHLKKNRPFLVETPEAFSQDQGQDGKDSPEQAVVKQQEMDRLAFCLQKLPLDLREAVVLRYYQELPFEDIAQIMDISLSAAKMRVYRGLKVFRVLMNNSGQ